jgi:hypothetical protein
VDYAKELDKAVRLHKALLVIHKGCQGLHPNYEPLNALVCNFVLGFVPVINVNCPHDSECQVTGREPYGGLEDLIENLEVVIWWLQMEINYEGGVGDEEEGEV